MNTYYVINDQNKIADEFDAEEADAIGRFESWLNDHGGLKEFLLVKKVHFGKLQVSTQIILT